MLSEAPQMGQTIHAQQREPKHPENVTAVSIRVAYLKFVIPTAVKRARAVVSARVGRRDLVFLIGLGAVALGKCGVQVWSGGGDTRHLIACLTSVRHSIIIQPCRIAIPNPAGERRRDSAGEGSAPLLLQCRHALTILSC